MQVGIFLSGVVLAVFGTLTVMGDTGPLDAIPMLFLLAVIWISVAAVRIFRRWYNSLQGENEAAPQSDTE